MTTKFPTESELGHWKIQHEAAADAAGKIFVVEWILGGRVTKLSPSSYGESPGA